MRRPSIHARLTVWYLAALSLVIVGFGTATRLALNEVLIDNLELAVDQRLAALAEFLEQEALGDDSAAIQEEAREHSTGMQPGHRLIVRDRLGAVLFERPGGSENASIVRRERFSVRGNQIEIEYGVPLDEVSGTIQALQHVMFALFPAALALAGFGGWILARRALAPLDEMTREARALSTHDLSARLSIPATGDELQRLAETWNDLLARIETSVDGIVRFTADAAHELRTPVAVVRATAELALRRERSTETYRKALGAVQEETLRMTELIEQLLLLARGDAQRWNFEFDAVRLDELVRSALEAAGPLAARRNVRLELAMPAPDSLVWADAGALRRLVLTLVDNSVKFTDPGGRVELRIAESSSEWVVEVADNGCGIPPADLEKAFDRFYRADPARTSGGGAGLGLSIARVIAEAHGGEIRAFSDGESGTRVRVQFPRYVEKV